MTAAERGAALVRRLRAELLADVKLLEERTGEVRAFGDLSREAPPERLPALAFTLDRAYTALEAILERVARTLEGGPPGGPDWHRTLLTNAGLEIPEVRVAVLGRESIAAADELRRLRHFLRHAYGARLDPVRVAQVADAWLRAFGGLREDLEAFSRFLEELASRLEGG